MRRKSSPPPAKAGTPLEFSSYLSARVCALVEGFDGPPRKGVTETTSTDDPILKCILPQIAGEFAHLAQASDRTLLETALVCANELFRRAKAGEREALHRLFQSSSHGTGLLDKLADHQLQSAQELARLTPFWPVLLNQKLDLVRAVQADLRRLQVGAQGSHNLKPSARWSLEQDYLPPATRLLGATGLKHENADPDEIDFYRPNELRALLESADKDLLPFVALAGLAGLREREIVRLTWEDVFRVPGHIEVGALKAKTRSRRLVEMVPALAAWLELYRGRTGPVWTNGYNAFHVEFARLRDTLKIPRRRNGLRHAFVAAHFAVRADEGLTAKEAGNSPAVVHRNYKALLTRNQGEAWFAVCPAPAAANVIPLKQDASA